MVRRSAERDELADAVALAYEAATGEREWSEFGAALCGLVGAQVVSLHLPNGGSSNLLQPAKEAAQAYLAYYKWIDPYIAQRGREVAGPPPLDRTVLQDEILPTAALHRTEYFNDYARHNQGYHMMGALIGLETPVPLGLHREEARGSFTKVEQRTLNALLPHLRRALELHRRLELNAYPDATGRAALDALSVCVIVVDAAMELQYANPAAVSLTAGTRSGLRLIRAELGKLHVATWHREETRQLERLVADAAAGGPGGALRIRAESQPARDAASLFAVVSPLPRRLALTKPHVHLKRSGDAAMVVACDLSRPRRVQPAVLCDLYGLTRTEAAIAASLAGGVTAESVARSRGVSLDTVRTQIRKVLEKTEAANLRDLERLLGLLVTP